MKKIGKVVKSKVEKGCIKIDVKISPEIVLLINGISTTLEPKNLLTKLLWRFLKIEVRFNQEEIIPGESWSFKTTHKPIKYTKSKYNWRTK